MAQLLPAIFFGHGNPMNAVRSNTYTEGWRRIGIEIPGPQAIPVGIRALVCARNRRHHQHGSQDDP